MFLKPRGTAWDETMGTLPGLRAVWRLRLVGWKGKTPAPMAPASPKVRRHRAGRRTVWTGRRPPEADPLVLGFGTGAAARALAPPGACRSALNKTGVGGQPRWLYIIFPWDLCPLCGCLCPWPSPSFVRRTGWAAHHPRLQALEPLDGCCTLGLLPQLPFRGSAAQTFGADEHTPEGPQ